MKRISLARLSKAALAFLWLLSLNVMASDDLRQLGLSVFGVMPHSMPGSEKDSPEQIELGKNLYFETALSGNGSQSCNSCHDLDKSGSGTEPLSISVGALGKLGTRNSLTTWNAGFQFVQFWDGRAKTLSEQAKSPILNPLEMAMSSEEEAVVRLKEKGYKPQFDKAFPHDENTLSFNNITQALAAFQRTLVTQDRFDDWLMGDDNALSEQEVRGMKRFVTAGCHACHNGPLMGGQLFMKMGLVNPYPNKVDKGRASVTGNSADNFIFKVPTMRNVGKTSPYFHDGAVFSLEQAVRDTAWHQLGVKLNEQDVEDMTAFLQSLDNKKKIEFSNHE
ncbi:cytochrome-c peroxidase [Grimontia marina]|uniref:Cytochrome c551 peroxidase n=1 Tax=Grimontia marina TaxID=646534 RepID=A0A128FGF0_9GAMM|nr:cytochrome c peroxidase [Grimontia marina]CZF85610.1 Cytochrome c551 peroxidase precursor [Grimontia marina]